MPFFIRIQDVADILIMTFLLYQLYSWFRSTRAMQVLLGLGLMTLIYFITRFLGLYMTSWILQELGTVLIILIIVVFQSEIRQALYRFSLLRYLFDSRQQSHTSRFQELAETLFVLAAKRTGAIIVFQRDESVADLMLNGVSLDCEITPQILESIFCVESPLHDGAALIAGDRISQASCHLPLSVSPDIPQLYGTRHRAALGLSEKTDAVVAVVSEERGEVSLVVGGKLKMIAAVGELIAALEELISPTLELPTITLRQRLFSNLLPKATLLLLVSVFWVLIMSRQGQITTVNVPVRFHGLPDSLLLLKSMPEDVELQLKAFSGLPGFQSKLDITADIDLSDIHDGQSTIRIKNSDIRLPSGMSITSITPQTVKIMAERKVRKALPVKIVFRGVLPRTMSGWHAVSSPASVVVEGPELQLGQIEAILTEEIDAARLEKGKEYRKTLLLPKNIFVTGDEMVTVKVIQKR